MISKYTNEYVKELEEEIKNLKDEVDELKLSLKVLIPHLNKDSMKEATRNEWGNMKKEVIELSVGEFVGRNTDDSNRR